MPRRRDPVPRARAAGHWLLGIFLLGLLGAAVVSAGVILWETLDFRQVVRTDLVQVKALPSPEPPQAPASPRGFFSARLFRSERTGALFPDASHYPRSVARWRQLTENLGGIVVEIGSLEELRALSPEDLLVLPEAPCLSSRELAAIRDHLEAGGSLVSNWAVGARDQECGWRGWQTVAQFTGAAEVRELAVREALFLTVPGGTPLSPGLDPGTRIEFRPAPVLAFRASGPRVYWSGWALNPAPDESGGGADVAATVTRTESGGRTAWFGFQLSHAATPRDSARLDRLVQNGILWAAGQPTVSVAPWPEGKRAALLFVEDVEAEHENAAVLAEVLKELEVPGTFYVVSQLVKEDSELARVLSSAGEVGSHSPDHEPLAGLAQEDQRARLLQGWTEVRDWTGTAPLGLRPPEEVFDVNTLGGWLEAGGSYLLATNQARTGSPEVYHVEGNQLVVLPRLLKDDYNVFVQDGAMKADRLTEAFLGGTEKLRSIGGLAVVATHTQILGTGRRLDAIRAVANTARSQEDWWIAEAREVAAWWGQKAHVRLSLTEPATTGTEADPLALQDDEEARQGAGVPPMPLGGAEILVEAPADSGIRGLWVEIILPEGAGSDVTPKVGGIPVSFTATDFGIRIPVGDLEAGERERITFR